MSPSFNLAEVISHYQRKIERHPEDAPVLRHSLAKLAKLGGVSIAVLQETGVGRVVNGLKKSADEEVARLAKDLVARWKEIVANEEEEEEEEEENHVEVKDEEDDDEEGERRGLKSSEQESDDDQPPRKMARRNEEEDEDESDGGEQRKASSSSSSPRKQHKSSGGGGGGGGDHHNHHHKKKSKSSKHHKEEAEGDNDDISTSSSRRKSKKSKKEKEDEKKSGSSGSSSRHHKNSKASSSSSSSAFDLVKESRKSKGSSSSDKPTTSNGYSKMPTNLSPHHNVKSASLGSAAAAAEGASSSSSMLAMQLPEGISPHYRPLPPRKDSDLEGGGGGTLMAKRMANQSQDEALSALIAKSKNGRRTAVYSGAKRSGYYGEVPSLFNLCIHVLQEHVESIEECGNLNFEVLSPILERASPSNLMRIEEYNPHLMEDTGGLWERFCRKHFAKGEREEMESWREMFERCTHEREQKLEMLKGKVKDSYVREKSGAKKAKLAYVGLNAKPPRNVMRAQAKNGTGIPVGHPVGGRRPGASLSPGPSGSGPKKPKIAPMMAKTLKMARGIKSGFRR